MQFNATSASILTSSADSLILPTGRQLKAEAAALNTALDGAIEALLNSGDFSAKIGSHCLLHIPGKSAKRLLLVGCDQDGDTLDVQSRDKIIATAAQQICSGQSKKALWISGALPVDEQPDDQALATAVAQSFTAASYRYNKGGATKHQPCRLKGVTYWAASRAATNAAKKGLAYGSAVGNGMNIARDLGNLPGNICTPNYLAKQAQAMAKGNASLTTQVLGEADMKKLKMGSLLSVSAGSDQPAKLIVMNYQGVKGRGKPAPIVLVGKAVTFDTGGISLKPGGGMDEMKFDMCGGASVFGVIAALAELQLPVNVIGVVPAVENMPSGGATKPGDVVTSMSGQTIEILNTDAEGRLILCDALTYSVRFKPAAIIDIATLTGACVMALGSHASGLMSNDQSLADGLINSGNNSGDRCWQMPLWPEYDQQLKSNFADMANIGGREAGTITAGCFLARFAKGQRWAHLDIAGTAWLHGAAKGSTGRPVPLLMNYISSQQSR
ncbi:MAG: leucyl aminopeptidase [Porticoccaceae bacterium]